MSAAFAAATQSLLKQPDCPFHPAAQFQTLIRPTFLHWERPALWQRRVPGSGHRLAWDRHGGRSSCANERRGEETVSQLACSSFRTNSPVPPIVPNSVPYPLREEIIIHSSVDFRIFFLRAKQPYRDPGSPDSLFYRHRKLSQEKEPISYRTVTPPPPITTHQLSSCPATEFHAMESHSNRLPSPLSLSFHTFTRQAHLSYRFLPRSQPVLKL